MFKALSPLRFFVVVMIYFVLLLGITIWSSVGDMSVDMANKETLFLMKVAQAVSVIMVFILPACMFVLFFSTDKLHYFLLHRSPPFLFIVISCVLIITALPLIAYLEGLNKAVTMPAVFSEIEAWMKASEMKIQQIEEAFLKDQSVGDLLMNLFVIAFMAAFSEELFFRGLIQRSMLNLSKNVHLSVWITAILFSAFHMQFYGFIPRVLLGAVLGYTYVWSGSLWTSVIVHFLNNALVLVLIYMVNTGYLPKEVEQIGMESDKVTLSWALSSLAMVLGSMFLLYRLKKPVQYVI